MRIGQERVGGRAAGDEGVAAAVERRWGRLENCCEVMSEGDAAGGPPRSLTAAERWRGRKRVDGWGCVSLRVMPRFPSVLEVTIGG